MKCQLGYDPQFNSGCRAGPECPDVLAARGILPLICGECGGTGRTSENVPNYFCILCHGTGYVRVRTTDPAQKLGSQALSFGHEKLAERADKRLRALLRAVWATEAFVDVATVSVRILDTEGQEWSAEEEFSRKEDDDD